MAMWPEAWAAWASLAEDAAATAAESLRKARREALWNMAHLAIDEAGACAEN